MQLHRHMREGLREMQLTQSRPQTLPSILRVALTGIVYKPAAALRQSKRDDTLILQTVREPQ